MGRGTIFYVHGSANRETAAAHQEQQLRLGLDLPPTSPTLRSSTWGVNCGPDLSFPLLDSILPEPRRELVATIEAAADDYLAPLRALGAEATVSGAAQTAPQPTAWRLLNALRAGVDLPSVAVPARSVRDAAATVQASPAFAAALSADDELLVDATLAGVVGCAIEMEAGGERTAVPAGALERREQIALAGADAALVLLGAAALFVAENVGVGLSDPLLRTLSRWFAERRNEMMRRILPIPADVLVYQRHGSRTRDFVREELASCERPIAALGHSLGGVILADALLVPDAPDLGVELLVTFGSQSALLAAVGATDRTESKPVISWLNIWTRYDFVSFLAGKVAPATDWQLEPSDELGFPAAHGIYFDAPEFFERIKREPVVQRILG